MSQKIHKVNLGGLEYRLTSDNEELLRKSVDLVNEEIDNLQNQSDVKLPNTQLYVLLSLNLAERLITLQENTGTNSNTFITELSKINELIEKTLN